MWFVTFLSYYGFAGAIFSMLFLLAGYEALLLHAGGTRFRVRLLWLPGALALWPLLALKWACTEK